MKIYIASSWRNQHGVEMLTALLREAGHQVVSWIENNFEEGMASTGETDFNMWVHTPNADRAFEFDTHGAMECDLFVYYGPAGKDAAAEAGMCYGQRLHGKTIPMLGLLAKGEDFGLMRKMFDHWFDDHRRMLDYIDDPINPDRTCRVCGCTDHECSGCIERTGFACTWVEQDLCSACLTIKPKPTA